MTNIKKGLKYLSGVIDKIERFIITVLFAEVIVIGFMQIVFRFVFRAPLSWSEELLRYSFVWITYLASSMGIMAGTHANVAVLRDAIPPKAQNVVKLLNELLTLFFCGVVFYISLAVLQNQISNSQVSTAMGIPMYIPYGAITVSFGFMIVQCLTRIFNVIEGFSGAAADFAN
jgi:TRAP-type C4-dicarboxylate transport system permease small subunit